MAKTFTPQQGNAVLQALIAAIQANKDFLSDIDGQIGDGDHGINMNKGFTLFEQELHANEYDLATGFIALSKILMNKIGGSMGPLYGMFFRAMGRAIQEADTIGCEQLGAMFNGALQSIQGISDAQPGDKTLIDCLVPAVDAWNAAIESDGDDVLGALGAMKTAAAAGRDSTKDLVAKKGRSSRLGQRSRGVLDAGACSCCLILDTIADTSATLLK